MTDQIEALLALWKEKTMIAAATRLRLTPSAISKRVAQLEREVGRPLIEPKGREVQLTPAGLRLVEKTEPLLSQLKSALRDDVETKGGELRIGVSESVLASWGALAITKAASEFDGLRVVLSAHRSPLVAEKVRSGDYDLGICAGFSERAPDLYSEVLLQEPLILIPSGLKKMRLIKGSQWNVLTIEPHASTWNSLGSSLKKFENDREVRIHVEYGLQSFSCVVQLAIAGFANGLVPQGIAAALGVPKSACLKLSNVYRPVSLIARPSALARANVAKFREALVAKIESFDFEQWRSDRSSHR